jgi:hypothetical protein
VNAVTGIRLSHGVMFVEYDGVTVKVKADGSCGISPITLSSLEWDLRTEPPHTWDYITWSDVDEHTRRRIEQIVLNFYKITGIQSC